MSRHPNIHKYIYTYIHKYIYTYKYMHKLQCAVTKDPVQCIHVNPPRPEAPGVLIRGFGESGWFWWGGNPPPSPLAVVRFGGGGGGRGEGGEEERGEVGERWGWGRSWVEGGGRTTIEPTRLRGAPEPSLAYRCRGGLALAIKLPETLSP